MMNRLLSPISVLAMVWMLVACDGSHAQATQADKQKQQASKQSTEANYQVIRDKLAQTIPVAIESIKATEIPGLLEVMLVDAQVYYISQDGQFLLSGSLYKMGDKDQRPENLTQKAITAYQDAQAPIIAEKLANLDEDKMVVFPAKEEKHVVTVFTDIDCGYCRKLHNEMAEYNKAGITVRYLGYPRAGLGSNSYDKLVSVWCAEDRQLAMNEAKGGGQLASKVCENPIADHMQLNSDFKLSGGTPAILTASGKQVGGYVPAARLADVLDAQQKQADASEANKEG